MYRCLRDVGLAIALLSETGQTIPISDMFDMFAYHVFGTTKCFASLVLRIDRHALRGQSIRQSCGQPSLLPFALRGEQMLAEPKCETRLGWRQP